jgi:uncharacterized protein YaaR (DUF327 family)
MDKIDFTGASLIGTSLHPGMKTETKKARAKNEGKGVYRSLFSELLERNAPTDLGPLKELAPSEEALAALMDEVHSSGSNLIERPFHDEILKYKRAVRTCVHYVVEHGYDVETVTGVKTKKDVKGETRWTNKVYHQVQVVDKKLEELAAAILSGQTTQLERVSKLDEITGLLVDLTVTGIIQPR